MSYETLIARRYLRSVGRRGRISVTAGIAVVGVALGVAALVIVLSVMNGFAGVVRDRLLGVNAHVTVRHVGVERISNYGEVMDNLSLMDAAVTGASPFIRSEGLIFVKEQRFTGVIIRGVDVDSFGEVSDLAANVDGGRLDLEDRMVDGLPVGGMVIGRYLANKLGVEQGEEVFLMVPEWTFTGPTMPRYRRFTLTGIFNTGYYEFDSGLVVISLKAAQRILGWGDEVSGIRVNVIDPLEANAVAGSLRRRLRPLDAGLYATSWISENTNLFAWIRLEKWFSFLALSLIIVVASFNIMSILSMIVMDKRREIGILKAMGATRKSLQRIFTYNGLTVGLAGVVLGNLIGFILCFVQERYRFISLPGDVYIISSLPVKMQVSDFAAISAAAVVICYLLARFPARSAALLEPVEAIRYE